MKNINSNKILNSKLFVIIEKLSKKERTALQKFLLSPYFNHRKDVVQLFEILTRKNNAVLAATYIFTEIYPTEVYDDQKLRLLMTYLFQQIENFLLYQHYQRNAVQSQIDLLTIYRERHLNKCFKTVTKKVERIWKQQQIFDSHFYESKHQFHLEQYLLDAQRKRANPQQIQEMATHLDVYYIAEKLRQSCLALTHSRVSDFEPNFGLLEVVLSYIKQHSEYLEIPAVSIYYHCFFMLKYPKEEAYFIEFRKAILNSANAFQSKEMRDLYLLAINFCSQRYNRGQTDYIYSAMTFYQKGLENGYFLNDGLLSRFTFRNVVTVGLITKKYDWTETFIETYHPYLEKQFRAASYNFSHARLAYERRQYERALSLLRFTEFKDILIHLSARTVMAKIYYQLDEFEVLESHLKATEVYIRRKEVIGYHRENYLNFVLFLQKIIMINPFDRANVQDIQQKLADYKAIAERKWLEQIIEAL